MKGKLDRQRVRSFAESVQPIYEYLDWEILCPDDMKVPDEWEIMRVVDRLYDDINFERAVPKNGVKEVKLETAGIQLLAREFEDGDVDININMIVSERSTK